MKRLHLFEIHDQAWCPRTIRDAETDYLQFVIAKTKPYAAIVPILATALQRTGTPRVLDLCSGAGGPWFWLQPILAKQQLNVTVCLTDKYPNLDSVGQLRRPEAHAVRYHLESVDATRIPEELTGFRTMFTAFHHFRLGEASALLADAVRRREGIAIFEGSHRGAPALLLALLLPVMVLVMTPFIRPFRWSRLLLTYLLPVVPMVCVFDYVVSCLRTYSVQELRELTKGLEAEHYQWDVGELKSTAGPIPVTYLVGVPIDRAA